MLLATRIGLLAGGRLEVLASPPDFLEAKGREVEAFRASLG